MDGPVTATAFIPARWNSSRLPHKNYLPCAGESLVSRAIRVAVAAMDIGLMDHVVVSADFHATSYAGEYDKWQRRSVTVLKRRVVRIPGLEGELNLDGPETTVSQLLAGLIRSGEWRELNADLYCVLLPTSPLRTLRHLVESRLLFQPGTDMVMSVTPFHQSVFHALRVTNGQLGLLDSARWTRTIAPLVHCGTVLWCSRSVAQTGTGFYQDDRIIVPYPVPSHEAIDVNTQLDLDVADMLLRRREALPGGQTL